MGLTNLKEYSRFLLKFTTPSASASGPSCFKSFAGISDVVTVLIAKYKSETKFDRTFSDFLRSLQVCCFSDFALSL